MLSGGRPAASASTSLRVLQMNVFEDGLTDAPAAIGLSPEFAGRLGMLLRALGDDGQGAAFLGFKPSRDMSMLPPLTPVNSAASLFGYIDVVYNILYHTLGGEARVVGADGAVPPPGPDLGNSLRTLFLCSTVDESGAWATPRFEAALEKTVASVDDAAGAAEGIRSMRERTLDPAHGTLSWGRRTVEGIWKRTNNVWRDKWCRDLHAFLVPPAAADTAQVLSRFCRSGEEVVPPGCACRSTPLPIFQLSDWH